MEPNHLTYHIAQAHEARDSLISNINIFPQFATDRPIITLDLDPPSFQCRLREGDSKDPNLLQCERCLRWIHAYCFPHPIPTKQLSLVEGWTCHEYIPPSTTNPCPQQLCTIHFASTPYNKFTIQKCLGGKQSLANFQASTTLTLSAIQNTPMQSSDPPNPEHLENNPNRHPPTTNVPPGLKRAIQQVKTTTSASTPFSNAQTR